MPSNHLILFCPLLLLPSIFPSTRVFSSVSALPTKWPKYLSFRFSISLCNGCSGLIFFRIDWFDLLAVQGTLNSLLQHHNSKASILLYSAFIVVQLSHSYIYFCSVAQLCPTLCDPMDCSTPGFPVLHSLLELVQTHVHWVVHDAIQPSCPLWSPSPLPSISPPTMGDTLIYWWRFWTTAEVLMYLFIIPPVEVKRLHNIQGPFFSCSDPGTISLMLQANFTSPITWKGSKAASTLPWLFRIHLYYNNINLLAYDLPSIFPSTRVFSTEAALCIK